MTTWLKQGYQKLMKSNPDIKEIDEEEGGISNFVDTNTVVRSPIPENIGISIQDSNIGESLLYKYEPSKQIPALKLYAAKNEKTTMRCVIRKTTLVIVESKEDHEEWWYILAQGYEGWAFLPVESVDSCMTRKDTYVRYEEWKGNNSFCCDGGCMFGADAKFFIFTNVLMVVPSILFILFVAPDAYYPIFTTVIIYV